jgi:methionyl-tRNA synthetase
MKKKFLLTATPPTTNGDLHLGHISGPYLGADIFKRARELFDDEVLYISSTDDNQSYLLTKSFQERRAPKKVVEDYSSKINKSLAMANIKMDAFTSPDTDIHRKYVQDFFSDLYNSGHIIPRELEHCYCEPCNQFLYEAFIKGKCPHCLSSSGGNFCEECGNPNDPLQLVDAQCTLCGGPPTIKRETVFIFPLEPLRDQLTQYYNENHKKWRPHLSAWYKKLLSDKLIDVHVSNVSDWGVKIQIEGYSTQSINVWFEMLPGHLATLAAQNKKLSMDFQWGKEESSNSLNIIQFFGFDNSFYYAVLHIAALIAKGYRCPETFIINEFYLLENRKFSTSRKHAIWASEFLEKENSDIVRLYLSLTGPENEQTNFSLSEFERFKSEWVGKELVPFLEQGIKVSVASNDDSIRLAINEFKNSLFEAYSIGGFSPRKVAAKLQSFISEVNQHKQNSPISLAAFLICAYPIMPTLSTQLWEQLAGPDHIMRWDSYLQSQFIEESKANDFVDNWSSSIMRGE